MSLNVTPQEIVARAEATGAPGLLARDVRWPRVELGNLVNVVNGAAYPSRGFNGDGIGEPLVRIRDVGVNAPTTYFSGDWEELHRVSPGDMLIGMDGDFRAARWTGPPALLNQRVCRLDIEDARLDPRWLLHTIQGYLDAIWRETSSVTVKHLSSRSIAAIPLPLPPLDEQRRIVDILEDHLSRLDAADQLLDANRRRLTAFTRSALNAATDRGADLVPLSDLVLKVEAGKSFGSASRPASGDEWGIVKVSAMTWGEFRPEENKVVTDRTRIDSRYEIKNGDLLVSRANTTEYVGAPVLVRHTRPQLLLSDKSLRLVPRSGWDPELLLLLLRAPAARAQMSALATGTKDSMRNISQGALLSIQVPRIDPGDQTDVIRRAHGQLEAATEQQKILQRCAARSTALRRSLLSEAFAGRLTTRGSTPLELADV